MSADVIESAMKWQLLLAAVCSLLAASCGGSTSDATQSAQPAKTACVQLQDTGVCGLVPPSRRVDDGEAHKLTTVLGDSFWLILPDELAPATEVVAVPGIPARVPAGVSTATARQMADRQCGNDFPSCKPETVTRETLPSGAILTRWEDASGTLLDFDLTTLELGTWTLQISHPDARLAERFARALQSSVDEDGYPRLTSADPELPLHADWANVLVWVSSPGSPEKHHHIEVIPGCEFSTKDPALGGSDAGPELEFHEQGPASSGRWCVDGRYWVDVAFIDKPRLTCFHRKLRIVRSLG